MKRKWDLTQIIDYFMFLWNEPDCNDDIIQVALSRNCQCSMTF